MGSDFVINPPLCALVVDVDLDPEELARILAAHFPQEWVSHSIDLPGHMLWISNHPLGEGHWAANQLGLQRRAPVFSVRPRDGTERSETVALTGQLLEFLGGQGFRVVAVVTFADELPKFDRDQVVVVRLRREEAIVSLNLAAETMRHIVDDSEHRPFDYTERAQISVEAQRTLRACSEIYRLPFFQDPDVQRSYTALVDEYWRAWDNTVPPGFWADYDCLKRGDLHGRETAIRFLEADPWFIRSGYLKADLLRFLARVPLSTEHQDRLRHVVLTVVDRSDRREFRHYCRLVRKVDSTALRTALAARLIYGDANVRRRAGWVLAALAGESSKRS